MKHAVRWWVLLLIAGVAVGWHSAGRCLAQDVYAGWERGGPYDSSYNINEFDQFKGTVTDVIEIVPLEGMATGIGLKVRDRDDELIEVHLGPKGFIDLKGIGLKKGDEVKVKGAWAEIAGKDVFMASKVKKGEYVELKVRRTSDGAAFWTLSKEELAKELEETKQ